MDSSNFEVCCGTQCEKNGEDDDDILDVYGFRGVVMQRTYVVQSIVDECTLCDMCFSTTCPYVPPHSLNIDFPHLMLRYRAVQNAKGSGTLEEKQKAETTDPFEWPHRDEPVEVEENVERELSITPPRT